jgi:hypothetical protein
MNDIATEEFESFPGYVADLVCYIYLLLLVFNFEFLFLQKDLYEIFSCGRDFDLDLQISDPDLQLIQNTITLSTEVADLATYLPDLVAYTCGIMDRRQKEWTGFENWYIKTMEAGVFGRSADRPIDVDAAFAY